MKEKWTGSCLCGKVKYQVNGPLRDVVNCHCTMCQKLNGGVGPHTKTARANLLLTEDSGLAWYRSSDIAKRGYCRECGSSLFWSADDQDTIGILAGSLNGPTGLKTIGHIFVKEKADFYEISDTAPQFLESSQGRLPGDFK